MNSPQYPDVSEERTHPGRVWPAGRLLQALLRLVLIASFVSCLWMPFRHSTTLLEELRGISMGRLLSQLWGFHPLVGSILVLVGIAMGFLRRHWVGKLVVAGGSTLLSIMLLRAWATVLDVGALGQIAAAAWVPVLLGVLALALEAITAHPALLRRSLAIVIVLTAGSFASTLAFKRFAHPPRIVLVQNLGTPSRSSSTPILLWGNTTDTISPNRLKESPLVGFATDPVIVRADSATLELFTDAYWTGPTRDRVTTSLKADHYTIFDIGRRCGNEDSFFEPVVAKMFAYGHDGMDSVELCAYQVPLSARLVWKPVWPFEQRTISGPVDSTAATAAE